MVERVARGVSSASKDMRLGVDLPDGLLGAVALAVAVVLDLVGVFAFAAGCAIPGWVGLGGGWAGRTPRDVAGAYSQGVALKEWRGGGGGGLAGAWAAATMPSSNAWCNIRMGRMGRMGELWPS